MGSKIGQTSPSHDSIRSYSTHGTQSPAVLLCKASPATRCSLQRWMSDVSSGCRMNLTPSLGARQIHHIIIISNATPMPSCTAALAALTQTSERLLARLQRASYVPFKNSTSYVNNPAHQRYRASHREAAKSSKRITRRFDNLSRAACASREAVVFTREPFHLWLLMRDRLRTESGRSWRHGLAHVCRLCLQDRVLVDRREVESDGGFETASLGSLPCGRDSVSNFGFQLLYVWKPRSADGRRSKSGSSGCNLQSADYVLRPRLESRPCAHRVRAHYYTHVCPVESSR